MVEKARILLIDDNEHSRHDLETVLSFLERKLYPQIQAIGTLELQK